MEVQAEKQTAVQAKYRDKNAQEATCAPARDTGRSFVRSLFHSSNVYLVLSAEHCLGTGDASGKMLSLVLAFMESYIGVTWG